MNSSPVVSSCYARSIAVLTWLGVFISYVCLYLGFKAVDFDLEAMTDPLNQLRRASEQGAATVEWSMLADIFGFYLLMIPAVVYVWYWLRDKQPFLMAVATVAMLMYILTGALGGGILSVLWPSLIRGYVQAHGDPVMSAIITEQFKLVTNLVYIGMWGRVEYVLVATWVGVVSYLTWPEKRMFALIGALLAVATLLTSLGDLLSIQTLSDNFMTFYMVGVPLWVAWAAAFIWKTAGNARP